MRKVLSLVLVLALVLGSFSMAFAAAPADVVGAPSETAVSVLMDLGVVSGYPDGTYKPAGVVTRAEMAKLIVAALGLSDYATGTTTPYSDMAGATWAQGYVAYATGLGVVSGYPDGTFKPNAPVSYAEAAAMIVRALGYNEASLLPATWPANFIVKAKSLGILDDIDSTVGGANRGDVALMLYAALGAKIGTYNVENGWVANDPTDTMLTRLSSSTTAKAVIDGEEPTAINLRAFVGAFAKTYLNSDDEVIAVLPDSSFFTGKFAIDHASSADYAATQKFTTSDDVDYTLKATLTPGAIHFFTNGEEVVAYAVTSKTSVTIAAELSGTKIDPLYSIMKWNISHGALATATALKKITSDTPSLLTGEFELTDADAIDLTSFELLGVKALADIKVDNVVYVYEGATNIRKVAVGTTVVTGDVTKINSDGDYTIGGKVYAEAAVLATGSESVSAGDTVKAYLDYYGDVYKFVVTEGTAENFAIALESDGGTTGLSGSDAVVKLFLADGTDKVFKADETALTAGYSKLVITGNAITWVADPAVNIVKYGVDKDGVMDSIKVFNHTTWTTHDGYDWFDATEDITDKGYYDGYAFASDAIIFTADDVDSATADDWSVTTLDKIKGTDSVYAWYIVDTDTNKIIVMAAEAGTSSNVDYGVLTDYADLPADADYIYEVTAIINSLDVTKNATTAVYNAAVGHPSYFYAIQYDSTGAFKTATVVGDSDVIVGGTLDYNVDWVGFADATLVDGSLDGHTLASDVTVYVYDAGYTVGSLDDVDGTYANTTLVDIDGDYVYDYVLVNVDLSGL